MKTNLKTFYLAIFLVVILSSVISCVEVKGKTNPYDPNNPNYKAPSNAAVLRGWKIDTTDGAPSPSLRCVNIPNGVTKTISFSLTGSTFAAPTFLTNQLKFSGFNNGTIQLTVNITSPSGSGPFATNITGADTLTFTAFYPPLNGTAAAMNTPWTYTITVKNQGDTDGSNSFWIDGILMGSAGGSYLCDFNGMTDSQLTGDKEQ